MFESITERISKRIRQLSEAISRFRLKWRYYASLVLLVAGYVYCVLGFGLVIPSILAPPLSLLALIPAFYLVCLGRVFCKYRTQLGKTAILIMEVSAVILIGFLIFLLCNYVLDEDAKMIIWFEIVTLVILAGPGLFVITHGHSLFGSTAIPHDQLAKMYDKLVRLNIMEQTPTVHYEAKEDDECYPTLVFYGNIVIVCVFVFLSIMITVDGIKKPIPKQPEDGALQSQFVLMCCHIAEGKEQPLYVFQTAPSSEADSGWQCLCDKTHDPSDAVVVGMDKAIKLCPQLGTIIREKQQTD